MIDNSCERRVTLTQALRPQEPIIHNLAQLYTHDFSEFWADTSKGDLLPDGRFAAYPLEEYWTRPGWSAALIWRGDTLAGFVPINDGARSDKPIDDDWNGPVFLFGWGMHDHR